MKRSLRSSSKNLKYANLLANDYPDYNYRTYHICTKLQEKKKAQAKKPKN